MDTTQADALAQRLRRNRPSRRDSLWMFAAATAPASLLQGCATSPVTGERILVGMSPEQERAVDRQHAPHQFSADMGSVQDEALQRYLDGVAKGLQTQVQRQDMAYDYRVLNANYVNAYTFPGGAMGVTRGIMTELKDESELAALLGHELGHVNARHAAQRQGQQLVAQVAIVGVAVAVGMNSDSNLAPLAGIGAQIGASALLSKYSRDHEREADALGQDYLVRAGYPGQGMTRLHEMLLDGNERQPSMLETMFSSHPMSAERRDIARQRADTIYAGSAGASPQRERFMDNTSSLRRIKPTIDACKNGETALSRKQLPAAQGQFETALRLTPEDYPANLRMAQTLHAQGRTAEARRFIDTARRAYPQEAQAIKMSATLKMALKDPGGAFNDLQLFDRALPGDPGILFFKGLALEGMGNQRSAAEHFAGFLRQSNQGQAAQYSQSRLKSWGYLK
jgi:beta-barrel assembly-enhancing protease